MHSWVCPKWAFSFLTRSYSVRHDILGLPSQISEVSTEGMQTRFPSGTGILGINGDYKRITRLLTPVYVGTIHYSIHEVPRDFLPSNDRDTIVQNQNAWNPAQTLRAFPAM